MNRDEQLKKEIMWLGAESAALYVRTLAEQTERVLTQVAAEAIAATIGAALSKKESAP